MRAFCKSAVCFVRVVAERYESQDEPEDQGRRSQLTTPTEASGDPILALFACGQFGNYRNSISNSLLLLCRGVNVGQMSVTRREFRTSGVEINVRPTEKLRLQQEHRRCSHR